jgi:hypothetical protein
MKIKEIKKIMLIAVFMAAMMGWSIVASGADCKADGLPLLPDGAFTCAVIPDTQDYDSERRHMKRGRKPGKGSMQNERIEKFVLSNGFTTEDIEKFRSFMLK